jgi:hypothetical protein
VTWVLVGYVAKRRVTRAGYVSHFANSPDAGFPCSAPVEEICSVSNCIAQGIGRPDDPLDLHSDAAQAWAVVPEEARADFALYAYRLWPVQFEDGHEEPIDLWWEPAVALMADSFVRLGWDAVVGGNGHSFGCSPMSCNSGADVVRCPEINRYCLVADKRAALTLARNFSITQPEPGPYCVVEVWRDTAARAEPPAAAVEAPPRI